jgi:hypothetical protein
MSLPVHLDPATAIRRDQRSLPKTDLGGSQLAIGELQHDGAHILVGEEVFTRELEVVEEAECVVKEGFATPAREEAIVASLRHLRIGARRPVNGSSRCRLMNSPAVSKCGRTTQPL